MKYLTCLQITLTSLKRKMNKSTAISCANIAFIKYWGKKDSRLNLPFNNSISMNLSNCLTTTTVEFKSRFRGDKTYINGKKVGEDKLERVLRVVDIVRKKSNIALPVRVASENNFPTSAGIASSSSAFSALALAASRAAGMKLSRRQLSILARLGSGSACRSIPDGYSEWHKGKSDNSSFAVQIEPPDHWDLRDIVVVVEERSKKASSTEGHSLASTSPFFKSRLRNLDKRIVALRKALIEKSFVTFGKLIEEEAIELHVIAMTSKKPIFYWNKGTIEVLSKIREWRDRGFLSFFTMDAGSNVHVICRAKDAAKVNAKLISLPEVLYTIINKPGRGACLINKHLF